LEPISSLIRNSCSHLVNDLAFLFEVFITSEDYVEHHLIKINLFFFNAVCRCWARLTFIGVGVYWFYNDDFAD